MKVIQLIELLKRFDKDAEVLVSSDEEGNSFSTVGSFDTGNFDEEKGTGFTTKDFMYEDTQNLKGNYIIIFPKI